MIRLEKAGREDLAALVQLQEMVRARLLPEGQPLPETAGDSLEDFFAHGVVLRALMEDDTMVGAVGGREVDGGQHLAQLLVHPQWQGQHAAVADGKPAARGPARTAVPGTGCRGSAATAVAGLYRQ